MHIRQKYWLCRDEKNNHNILFNIFFKSFKFHCCSFCLIKKELTVQVPCLFFFYLVEFFKEKIKSVVLVGFIGFFKWTFKKKTWVVFFGRFFFTTTLVI